MTSKNISNLLPGFNCGECKYRQCADFAEALLGNKQSIEDCPYMRSAKYSENLLEIREILGNIKRGESETIKGIIDGLKADFTLAPLPGEPSCREDLYPFDRKIDVDTLKNAYIRYRPLGCPVTHFAKVIDVARGILTVHLIGPVHRITGQNTNFEDIGICMVAGFYGVVNKGKMPHVSQTVRFIPDHCMMQKVHSGVIVHSEGSKVRIEIIDLKVW